MKRSRRAQPLLVRHARLEEAAALRAACFPEQALDGLADYLAWCLAEPGRPTRLVGLIDGKIVAHVEVTRREGGAWVEISSLVVARSHEKAGIGRRVIGAVARLAQRWQCAEVRVQVEITQRDLIEQYQRWGFEPRGWPVIGWRWLALTVAPAAPPESQTPQVTWLGMDGEPSHS